MAKIERVYNVPLRKEWLKVPKYKRAKKAVAALREFLQKHMKSENVKLGPEVNKLLWVHGIKNPPHHVKVTVMKNDDGRVDAELFGFKAKTTQAKVKKTPAKPEAKSSEKTKKADETKTDKSEEKSEAKNETNNSLKTAKQEKTEPKTKKASKKSEISE